MLKGKKGLYVLLPVVVFVWGAIIYQVVDALAEEDIELVNISPVAIGKIETKEREIFTLGEVARDPFLGTVYVPPKPKVVPKANVGIKKQETPWPSIQYKGRVSAPNAKSAIFLIEINGSEQLMRIRDRHEGVQLITGTTSAIKMRFKGETKQFQM